MAQAVLETETIDQMPPVEPGEAEHANEKPDKRKGGRPITPHSANADELKDEDGFFSFLASLKPEDWEKYTVFGWRTDPWFDNTNAGRDPKYIFKETRAVDQQSIKEAYGSGSYRLDLNRAGVKNDRTVARIYTSILDEKYPPALPPGDWLDHPKNKKWLSWRPLIEHRWEEITGRGKQKNGNSLDIETMLKLANSRPSSSGDQLSAALVGILPKLLEQQSQSNDPARAIDVIEKAKALVTPPQQSDSGVMTLLTTLLPLLLKREQDPMLAMLITQLTEAQKQNSVLIGKMFDMKLEERKQPDTLSQVKQMAEVLTTVASVIPSGEPASPWLQLAQETVPKALDMVGQFTAMRRAPAPVPRQPAAPAPQPVQINTGQPPPPGQSVHPVPPQPIQMTPQPEATVNAEVSPQIESNGAPAMDIMMRTYLAMISQQAAAALSLAMPGHEFADRLCERIGGQTYDEFIEANPDQAKLIDMIRSIPEAWQLLAPYEQVLPKFIAQFYEYSEPSEVTDDTSDTTAPDQEPVSRKPRKKGAKK